MMTVITEGEENNVRVSFSFMTVRPKAMELFYNSKRRSRAKRWGSILINESTQSSSGVCVCMCAVGIVLRKNSVTIGQKICLD